MQSPPPSPSELLTSVGSASPAFTLWSPPAGRAATRVVAAVAHAGRRYPPELLAASRLSLEHLRQLEDAYVDVLARDLPQVGVPVLVSDVARAFVDLNRAEDEIDPLMIADWEKDLPHSDWAEGGLRHTIQLAAQPSARVAAGLGCLPKIAADGRELYRRKLTRAEARARLDTVYQPYHRRLAALIADTHSVWGEAILLDLHSMPSRLNGKPIGADIVLGNRHGATCAEWVTQAVEACFSTAGFRVARNAPYAGGHVTQMHGAPHRRRHALQIEVCRSLYLDESNLKLTRGVDRVRQCLTEAARLLTGLEPAASAIG